MKTVADLVQHLQRLPQNVPLVAYDDADQYGLVQSLNVRHLTLHKTDRWDRFHYWEGGEKVQCVAVSLSLEI